MRCAVGLTGRVEGAGGAASNISSELLLVRYGDGQMRVDRNLQGLYVCLLNGMIHLHAVFFSPCDTLFLPIVRGIQPVARIFL